MAFTYIVINKIINQCIFIIVTLYHKTVDVLELVSALNSVCYEYDTLFCRSGYQKAIIRHVVGDFKGLHDKSSDVSFLLRKKPP